MVPQEAELGDLLSCNDICLEAPTHVLAPYVERRNPTVLLTGIGVGLGIALLVAIIACARSSAVAQQLATLGVVSESVTV